MDFRNSTQAVMGVFAMLIAVPAFAAEPTPANREGYDPKEKICETITITGSRLSTKRFCVSRAEWEERRRADREMIEASQRSPCVVQRTSNQGNSC